MKRTYNSIGAGILAAAALVVAADAAIAQPVFTYDAADATLPTVVDSSGAGNNGTATGAGVTTAVDAPAAFPGGTSFVFDASADRITTDAFDLLDNAAVVGAGGFTIDAWVKTDGVDMGTSASVVDYAGTERIQFDPDGNVTFRISNSGDTVTSTVPVTDNQWHHVTASFFVTDGSDVSNVIGNMALSVDGTSSGLAGVTLTDFGDSLDRPIGVGGHPIGFDGDIFIGAIFNPSVSLGAIPEPASLALVGSGLLALGLGRRRRTA